MHRAAITLFELLLVLTLCVLVCGLAWPAIEGSFEASRLRAAADDVRAALGDARYDAMRTGMPHLFRYEPDAAEYSITRWDWNATSDAEDSEAGSGDSSANVNTEELPEGIVFMAGEVASDSRTARYAAAAAQEGVIENGRQGPILFYPDGTASDGVVLLKSKQGLIIRVVLRGLTGIARASETMSLRELLDEEQ